MQNHIVCVFVLFYKMFFSFFFFWSSKGLWDFLKIATNLPRASWTFMIAYMMSDSHVRQSSLDYYGLEGGVSYHKQLSCLIVVCVCLFSVFKVVLFGLTNQVWLGVCFNYSLYN